MECPKCGGPTTVNDCRESADGTFRRRRKCLDCGERFTTKEVLAEDYDSLTEFAAAVKHLLAMARKLEWK